MTDEHDETTEPAPPESPAPIPQTTDAPEPETDPDDPHGDQLPRIHMETSEGPLVFGLWQDVAPATAKNFHQLVHDGFYDGLTFHRVIPGYIVQAGCPHGDGTGGPGYQLEPEFNDRPHERGVLSMARTADPGSAGSQFFICLERQNCAHLDHEYTAFGQVVEGLETLDQLADTHLAFPELGTPSHPPQILHCYEVWDHDSADDPANPEASESSEEAESSAAEG